ncbi:MAG: DNA-directed RNA polymerase subunit D [Candidatus Micrarchaeaceae archaeon]
MEIEVKENTDKVLRFIIEGEENYFINAFRRAVINYVETFAIDSVNFYENTSAMFDEYIAHRIGLVPIVTPKVYPKDAKIFFTLEAIGPSIVYSKDLKSSDAEIVVANEKIPIIKLAQDQMLRIDCEAIPGNALRHAKFQPGLATFEELGDKKFEFYIESFGQMPARDIAQKAIESLEDMLKKVKVALK